MNRRLITKLTGNVTLLGCALLASTQIGCQTTVGGQTLPSHSYVTDDIQFFPKGPETRLPNLRRALEQYRLEREGLAPDTDDDAS